MKNKSKRSRARRGLRLLGWVLLFLAIGPSLVGFARVGMACRFWDPPNVTVPGSTDPAIEAATQSIADYARPEDQTYLTLPEWYIVYSADEYAAFIAEHPPSQFPYFEAVGQYWQSYVDVCEVIRGRFPPNGGYHFTLGFIGVSFTAETMLRGAYENTLGSLTEWLSSDEWTAEDEYARAVAKEYGDFLHETPWYVFPYGEKFKGVWTETGFWGPNLIRKWERKFALSLDYGIKTLYGGLVNAFARATYGGPDVSKIYAVTEGLTETMEAELDPDVALIREIEGERQLVRMTRFEVFTQIVPELTAQGLRFVEIAGNDELLVTLFAAPSENYTLDYGEYLFDLPVLTEPEMTRVAVKVKVRELHLFLAALEGTGFTLEHIYDY